MSETIREAASKLTSSVQGAKTVVVGKRTAQENRIKIIVLIGIQKVEKKMHHPCCKNPWKEARHPELPRNLLQPSERGEKTRGPPPSLPDF